MTSWEEISWRSWFTGFWGYQMWIFCHFFGHSLIENNYIKDLWMSQLWTLTNSLSGAHLLASLWPTTFLRQPHLRGHWVDTGFSKDETCWNPARSTRLQIGWQEFCHLGNCPPCRAEFSMITSEHVGTCRNMSEHVGTLRLLFFGWLNAHYGLCRCRVVVHEPIFCACGKNSIEPPSVWSPDWSCAVAVEPSLSSLEHRKIVLICIRSLTFLT